jgi:hypothetical protein
MESLLPYKINKFSTGANPMGQPRAREAHLPSCAGHSAGDLLTGQARPDRLTDFINAKAVDRDGSLDEFRHCSAIREIDEALDTWLGSELQAFGLWNGERDRGSARRASPDESAVWHRSHQAALDAGKEDAGEQDWLTYLVPMPGVYGNGSNYLMR